MITSSMLERRVVIAVAGTAEDDAGGEARRVSCTLRNVVVLPKILVMCLSEQLIFVYFNLTVYFTQIRQYIADRFNKRKSAWLNFVQGVCIDTFRHSAPPAPANSFVISESYVHFI